MEKELLESLYELNDLIKDSKEYKELKLLEEKMLNTKEFIILSSSFKTYQEKYNDALKYKLDTNSITKQLSNIEEELYKLDVVKNYLDALNKVNKLLKEVTSIINNEVIRK